MPSSSPSPVRVALLVVTYRSAADVATLLASVPREEDVEVVCAVVDNSESPDEVATLERIARSEAAAGLTVDVVASPTNGGYAAGNNLAFRTALRHEPDVVVVANPDVRWVEGALGGLAAHALAHPQDVVSVPTTEAGVTTTGVTRLIPTTGLFEPSTKDSDDANIYVSGHFFAMTAARFADLEGFTEDYFLFCEELDLCLRNRHRGGGIETYSGALVEHVGGGAINGEAQGRSLTSYDSGSRSRVMLYRRFPRLRRYVAPFVVLRTVWAATLAVRGQRDAARSVVRALWSGLRVPLAPVRDVA